MPAPPPRRAPRLCAYYVSPVLCVLHERDRLRKEIINAMQVTDTATHLVIFRGVLSSIGNLSGVPDPDLQVFWPFGSGSVIICTRTDPAPDPPINKQKN